MKYRKIETRIWNDAKFRSISDDAKLAFLFVLTHPGMTSLGAMRGTIGGLAEELGWTRERLSEAFKEAFCKGLLKGDVGGCLIWAPNFLKYNAPESPNVVKSWAHGFNDLPECDLKHDVLRCAIAVSRSMTTAFKKAFDESFKSLIEGLPKPSESLSKGFANQEPKAPIARAEQVARPSPEKDSVDAPRQTTDGTPSASDGLLFQEEDHDRLSKEKNQSGAEHRSAHVPEWELSDDEISAGEAATAATTAAIVARSDPMKATPEFDPWLIEFRRTWNATEGTKKHTGRFSRQLLEAIWARRADPWFLENWKEALSMFPLPYFQKAGELVGMTKFFTVPNFVENVIEGKWRVDHAAVFAQPKPDYKTSQAESMMSELDRVLSKSNSQQSQQKAISHE